MSRRRLIPNPKIGIRFGRLIVDKLIIKKNGDKELWHCQCSCGIKKWVWAHNLLNGNTKSCGCYRDKRIKEACVTHGMSKTRPWFIWVDMIRRCENKKNKSYSRYGGRGINVCPQWHDFSIFWNDMKSSYKENLQLDRINNNGEYSKVNCRWVDRMEQANNKRNNRFIIYKGKEKTLALWCRELNLKYQRTLSRLNMGWSVEDAFNLSKQLPHQHEYNKKL